MTLATRSFREQARETWRLGQLAVLLVWRTSPKSLVALLTLVLLQAFLPPLQLVLLQAVLDHTAYDLGLAPSLHPWIEQFPLSVWIILAAMVLAISQLAQPFIATFQSLIGDRLTGHVTELVIRAANRWPGLARFEDPSFVDDLQRARRHASHGGLDLVMYGSRAIVSLLTASGLAALLFSLHPLAPLLLILATLPSMAQQWEYGHRTGSHIYWQTPEARRLEYSRDVLLTPATAKDVRLYELGPFFTRRYTTIFDQTTGVIDCLRRRLSGRMALVNLLSVSAVGSVYLYLVTLVLHGQRTIGDLSLYGGAATLLQMALLDLGADIGILPGVFRFLPGLFRVLDAPADLPLEPAPRRVPRPIREGLVFDQVTFTYPGHTRPVLRGVSFQIHPKESVALVGLNGAGKTTIVKLLLRLYDPIGGRILLDGVDLRDYDLSDLRQEIGVIFQDFVRYELSVRENIAVGQIDALYDEPRLHAAAALAGSDGLLERLPYGLDTQLGRLFGGVELSGGEWQKVALARAFVRTCQLLILDEPTAAVDVQTEYEIFTRFHTLMRDRMTLLISHRLSTVRMANRILYLADGSVQEAGSHAQLMKHNGAYARLYRLQATQYLGRRNVP